MMDKLNIYRFAYLYGRRFWMHQSLFDCGAEHIFLDELAWDNGFGENKLFAKIDEVESNNTVREIYDTLMFPSYDLLPRPIQFSWGKRIWRKAGFL
jgi:hypothetical protein